MKDKVIKDAMSSIENRIRHVYNQGLEDGLNDGLHDSIIINKDVYGQGYEKGSQDAWECARKIYKDLSIDKCIEIFEGKSWFDYTASEVMALINKYEKQKQNEKSCKNCGNNDCRWCINIATGDLTKWTPRQTEDTEIKVRDDAIIDKDIEESLTKCAQNLSSIYGCMFTPSRSLSSGATASMSATKHNIDSLILKKNAKCEKCVHKDDDFDCHNFCVPYNFDHFKEKQNNDNDSNTSQKEHSSDNKEDGTYVYLYKGTFSQFKKGNSVILSTDITYWDRNIHDDKVLKAGEIHTLKEYFPETGACLITINNEMPNKDRCKKCPNDHKCRLCLTGINWTNRNR